MLLISSSILSSCQVLVNSFHLQAECCPNYIILRPTLSCFNRSIVPLCSSSFRLFKLCISFQLGCCLNLFVLITLPYRSAFNFVLLRCFISFNLFNLARFFGFTRLSKKQLSFPYSFFFRCPSGAILDLGTRSSRSGGVL